MGRFDHLKKDNKMPIASLGDFIEGANKEQPKKAARKRPSKQKILLSIAGRAPNRDDYASPTLLYVRKDLQDSIDQCCSGTRQAILNYLLKRGLDDLIAKGERVVEEVE